MCLLQYLLITNRTDLEKFAYTYRKSSIHVIQLVVLGILSFVLLSFAFPAFIKLFSATGADRIVFVLIASGMGLAGTLILCYALWYFFRVKNFFRKQEWFGVEITDTTISCKYFDFLRIITWQTEIKDVESIRQDRNRGRFFISLKTAKRRYNIPLNEMDLYTRERLVKSLKYLIQVH